jgi:hypothetical protein
MCKATCNQLIAEQWQLGHFIFHSGNSVPQSWQYQISFRAGRDGTGATDFLLISDLLSF